MDHNLVPNALVLNVQGLRPEEEGLMAVPTVGHPCCESGAKREHVYTCVWVKSKESTLTRAPAKNKVVVSRHPV